MDSSHVTPPRYCAPKKRAHSLIVYIKDLLYVPLFFDLMGSRAVNIQKRENLGSRKGTTGMPFLIAKEDRIEVKWSKGGGLREAYDIAT